MKFALRVKLALHAELALRVKSTLRAKLALRGSPAALGAPARGAQHLGTTYGFCTRRPFCIVKHNKHATNQSERAQLVRSARSCQVCKMELQQGQFGGPDGMSGPPNFARVFEASGQFSLPLPIENEDFASWRASRRPETFFLVEWALRFPFLFCSQTGQVRSDGLQDGQVSLTRSGQQADV